jgi:stage II sporulation protein R
MKKMCKRMLFCGCIAACVWGWSILCDRQMLNEQLIRLHVVANSDSAQDQQIKLRVRDAVVESLSDAMADFQDIDQARAYIEANLPKIRQTANRALEELGCDYKAVVSLGEEVFDTRFYDTFKLPAGVYEALRITIGEGEGKNWWCVVFPTLCVPAATEDFEDVAAGAGFPDGLTAALEGKNGYEIRFYLLDLLGKLEGYLHKG